MDIQPDYSAFCTGGSNAFIITDHPGHGPCCKVACHKFYKCYKFVNIMDLSSFKESTDNMKTLANISVQLDSYCQSHHVFKS